MEVNKHFYFHINLTCKDNKSITVNKFIRCDGSQCIGDGVHELIKDQQVSIDKITTTLTASQTNGTDAPPSTPVQVLASFGAKYIHVDAHTCETSSKEKSASASSKNVFDILMSSQKNTLPPERYKSC